jgi:GNAT superfamily N-acetyltransferase
MVRRAVPEDTSELIRLRGIMLASVTGVEPDPGPWQDIGEQFLRKRLAEPDGTLAAVVVDQPDRTGSLAACAVGTIEYRLPAPENPSGMTGYVFNVVTDPGYRRRGYSRGCLRELLAWYRQRGVTRVDLRASPEAAPLYESLGFARSADPAMRLRLDS